MKGVGLPVPWLGVDNRDDSDLLEQKAGVEPVVDEVFYIIVFQDLDLRRVHPGRLDVQALWADLRDVPFEP
jgi:hypothetical protein